MQRYALIAIALTVSSTLWAAPPASGPMSTTLKVGDMAPDFTLPATDGKPVTLSSFKGKENVVLAFFPAAFTGGCTAEMQKYQLGIDKFKVSGTQVFGISEDNSPSQKEFATKLSLSFPLLSDFAERKVAADYGVLMPGRGMAKRVTFVIDQDGKITYMEQNTDAVDTTGASDACSRLAHRTASK
jgi:peroxiredoxin